MLTRYARYLSQALGEQVLARLREDFVGNALALPGRHGRVRGVRRPPYPHQPRRRPARLVGALRPAGVDDRGGDGGGHLRRRDQCRLVGRPALPLGLPPLVAGLRWYLRRAKDGYLKESASYSAINATLTETVEGARTVEALGLGDERIEAIDDDIRRSYAAERYTLYLRTVFFPNMELSYLFPTVATLLLGGWLYSRGSVSLGEVTAATLYVQMLIDPVDRIVSILDELQVGQASLARLLGVALVPDDRTPTGRVPSGEHLDADDVRFAYVDGRDVLHGVDLGVEPGERIAMVGPSGAGKSTLGRLLAGIHPPRTGSVTVGGVGLVELPLGDLRGHVALVTQEHHVFVGTLRENLALAAPPGATDDGHPGGPGRRRRPRLGRRAPRRARHARRLRRSAPHRRPGPAGRARPAGARRPAHPGPRRGDLLDRPAGRPAPRALAGRRAARPHRHRDRAPALLRPRRRPGRRRRGRPDQRARLPRRAGRGRRARTRGSGTAGTASTES